MRIPRDHAFVRSDDPNFGSAFGGGCAEQVDSVTHGRVTCGFPESAHPAQLLAATHEAIAAQVRQLAAGQLNLMAMILAVCPGPHQYVQHRDRKPPWCKACGYTGSGFRVKTSDQATGATRPQHRLPHCPGCAGVGPLHRTGCAKGNTTTAPSLSSEADRG